MLELRLKGSTVELHFLFLAVLTFFFLLDESGAAAIGLLAGLMHECGHIAAFVATGYAPRRLSFEMTGIRLEKRTYEMSCLKESIVLLAGSAVNFITCGVLALSAGGIEQSGIFAGTHLVLGIINLLPVRSLDGGKLLLLWTGQLFPMAAAECIAKVVQAVFLVFVTGVSGYLICTGGANFSLIILCAYLWMGALKES